MRRFADRDMWAGRNVASGRGNIPNAPTEIPAHSIILTEEGGARHSDVVPLYTSNVGGLEMIAATDYGTLVAAGRPL